MAETKGGLKHILLAKFKEGIPDEDIQKLIRSYASLVNVIEPMKAFEWGTNVSVENLHQGFTHVFESTLEGTDNIPVYLAHPAHVEFANALLPTLEKAASKPPTSRTSCTTPHQADEQSIIFRQLLQKSPQQPSTPLILLRYPSSSSSADVFLEQSSSDAANSSIVPVFQRSDNSSSNPSASTLAPADREGATPPALQQRPSIHTQQQGSKRQASKKK